MGSHLQEMSEYASPEMKQAAVARAPGRGKWGVVATDMGFHLEVEKTFWNQVETLVAQRGECAKSHGVVHFKMVNLCLVNATSEKAKREKKKNVREARRQDASRVWPPARSPAACISPSPPPPPTETLPRLASILVRFSDLQGTFQKLSDDWRGTHD